VTGAAAAALRPALLWNDQRTSEQCAAIERAAGGRAACVEAVGNAALPGFTLPKLLWVREHEPEVWARVAAWCLPKDFIRLRLTGRAGDGCRRRGRHAAVRCRSAGVERAGARGRRG
jgi:xylulokinase